MAPVTLAGGQAFVVFMFGLNPAGPVGAYILGAYGINGLTISTGGADL